MSRRSEPNERILYDAMRRQTIANDRSIKTMVVLSAPSYVKNAIKEGLLKPYSTETPKVQNWYDLTEKGLEKTAELYKELESFFGEKAVTAELLGDIEAAGGIGNFIDDAAYEAECAAERMKKQTLSFNQAFEQLDGFRLAWIDGRLLDAEIVKSLLLLLFQDTSNIQCWIDENEKSGKPLWGLFTVQAYGWKLTMEICMGIRTPN